MTPKDIAIIITASIIAVSMFLIGVVYHICEYIKSKRPHASDDEEDNPIIKFKDDLAEIYESNPNGKLKKLAQAVWNRVEEIEKWHNDEIHDWERKYYSAKWDVGELNVKCDGYREELDEWTQRCEELQSKLNESQERLKRESAKAKTLEGETDKLRDMLRKAAEAKAKTQPIPVGYSGTAKTATEATELAERLQNMTSQPIVMDSETLNETQTKNEEFIKQLRDWWGLEASKAVELPNTDKKKQDDGWVDAIEAARDPNKWPEYMAKVEGIPNNLNKYKVTLYDIKENETIESWLYGTDIEDALKGIDRERYGVVAHRRW